MDFAGSKYYELNRALLLSIGLWPYEESTLKRIKIFVSSGFLMSFLSAMMAKIVTSRYNMMITLRTLSTALPCLIVILKYITFLLIPASLKGLMERMQNDWNTLKDAKELEIIQKYTHFGRLCTICILVLAYTCLLGFLILLYTPSILDVVMPLNETRKRRLVIDVEYFIDQNEHFYVLSCLLMISLMFSINTAVATESLYIVYVHHVCGMFKITWFYDFLWSNLAVSYFLVLIVGVVSLSINMLRVYGAFIAVDTDELITSVIFIFVHFFYMLFGNIAGQVFIDHSIDVHNNACDSRWYNVALREQKLMLFILSRSMHSCKLVTGGTFVLSLEGFTSLVATSVSYFTVLSSVRN